VAAGDTVVLTATLAHGDSSDIQGYSFTPTIPSGGGEEGVLSLSPRVTGALATAPAPVRQVTAGQLRPMGATFDKGSSAGLPPCGPGVLHCYVVPERTGRWTVDALVRRIALTAEVAITATDSGIVDFTEDPSGGPVITSRSADQGRSSAMIRDVLPADAAATLAPGLISSIPPSEVISVSGDKFYSKKKFVVRVVDRFGVPIPNSDVHLTLEAHPRSGGHDHNRPKFPRDPGALGSEPSTARDTVVNTGASGAVLFTYRAPDPSGLVTVHGTAENSIAGYIHLVVKNDSLVHVDEIPGVLQYVGDRGTHPDPFWTTVNERRLLHKLADTLVKTFADSVMCDTCERFLGLNDASLRLGGQFDIGGNWLSPHADHRRGQGADIRTRDKSEDQQLFMLAYWQNVLGGGVYDERGPTPNPNTGAHYHFKECPLCLR
jgi:hypothetical protein